MHRLLLFSFFMGTLSLAASEIDDKTTDTLRKLSKVIATTSQSLSETRSALDDIGDDPAKKEEKVGLIISETELSNRLLENKVQFNEVATGIRDSDLTTVEESNLDLAEEVKEILRPGVRALKEATARPREIEQLRARKQRLVDQRNLAISALERLENWNSDTLDEKALERLSALEELWGARKADAEGQLSAIAVKLEQREFEKGPVLKPVSEAFSKFFRGRGLNLLKAIGAMILVWFALRYLWTIIRKLPLLGKRTQGSFPWRVLDLTAVVLTGFFAAVSAMIVLYFSGDWLLLTLAIVVVAGLIWTAKSTVPKVLEQTKMLLNLGPVRKGERLTFEGVPWEVGSIGIYTELRNEELTGGLIRMSINRLSTLRSRPHDESEPWFPSRTGDWLLVGGGPAKIVTQTPEYVQVIRLGGARENFPTADFLAMAPVNLSHNFRVKVTFGIDYAYQSIVTTKAPGLFKARLMNEIVEMLAEREHLNSINVEFSAAGASSLDFDVLADFKGAAADRYQKITRAISRICVDVCNEQGWEIPFTQITVNEPSAAANFAEKNSQSEGPKGKLP